MWTLNFMKKIKADGNWSLMCPGFHEVWGEENEALYEEYKTKGKARKTVKAQIEADTPYRLCKDACNRKSNRHNLGFIKCSNLSVLVKPDAAFNFEKLRHVDKIGKEVNTDESESARVGPIWVQPIQIYSPSRYFCQYRYRYISTNISVTDTDIFILADF